MACCKLVSEAIIVRTPTKGDGKAAVSVIDGIDNYGKFPWVSSYSQADVVLEVKTKHLTLPAGSVIAQLCSLRTKKTFSDKKLL